MFISQGLIRKSQNLCLTERGKT